MTGADEHSGGCQCGAMRYAVSGAAIWSAGCCCRDCARAAGTPYIVWVGFPPDRVRFLSGAPRVHASSEGVLRGFCERCGTTLTYGRDPAFEAVEPTLYVAAATLDDPDAYPPSEVVWYDQRPGWFALAGDIPLHGEVSPENAARSYARVLETK
ncbi:MAG: GFA family protein [Alphaproteobacteria bacterium]|nr:GFA family protein [Alphaproteobacteria bacterium]